MSEEKEKEKIKISVTVDLWGVFWAVVVITWFFGDAIISVLERI